MTDTTVRDKIADIVWGNFCECGDTVDELMAALPELTAPKVKPLVWGDVGTDGSIGAKPTEQNGYFIIKTKGDAYRVYGITGVSDGGTEYVGLDEAKAAAQVHHDALIRSALVTQGEE